MSFITISNLIKRFRYLGSGNKTEASMRRILKELIPSASFCSVRYRKGVLRIYTQNPFIREKIVAKEKDVLQKLQKHMGNQALEKIEVLAEP